MLSSGEESSASVGVQIVFCWPFHFPMTPIWKTSLPRSRACPRLQHGRAFGGFLETTARASGCAAGLPAGLPCCSRAPPSPEAGCVGRRYRRAGSAARAEPVSHAGLLFTGGLPARARLGGRPRPAGGRLSPRPAVRPGGIGPWDTGGGTAQGRAPGESVGAGGRSEGWARARRRGGEAVCRGAPPRRSAGGAGRGHGGGAGLESVRVSCRRRGGRVWRCSRPPWSPPAS